MTSTKRILAVWSLVLMAIYAYAQEYHPFVEDGKVWYEEYHGIVEHKYIKYFIDGDTIIGGKPRKKLYRTIYYASTYTPHTDFSYEAALEEHDKKVTIVRAGSTEESYSTISRLTRATRCVCIPALRQHITMMNLNRT